MCYRKSNISYHYSLGPLTKHHRKCKSKGGLGTPNNISYVPDKLHIAYHKVFGNCTPHQIANILNEHWIDPAFKIIVVPNE